jgi:hypothetical protein
LGRRPDVEVREQCGANGGEDRRLADARGRLGDVERRLDESEQRARALQAALIEARASVDAIL